jgi:hypothetical protein
MYSTIVVDTDEEVPAMTTTRRVTATVLPLAALHRRPKAATHASIA